MSRLLLERAVSALQQRDLPLDLAVQWEREGVEAWELGTAASMVQLLALVSPRLGVAAAAALAREALVKVPEGETRPLRAIEAAEAWAASSTAEAHDAAHRAVDDALTALRAARTDAPGRGDVLDAIEVSCTAAAAAAHAHQGTGATASFARSTAIFAERSTNRDLAPLLRSRFAPPTVDELLAAVARSS